SPCFNYASMRPPFVTAEVREPSRPTCLARQASMRPPFVTAEVEPWSSCHDPLRHRFNEAAVRDGGSLRIVPEFVFYWTASMRPPFVTAEVAMAAAWAASSSWLQ